MPNIVTKFPLSDTFHNIIPGFHRLHQAHSLELSIITNYKLFHPIFYFILKKTVLEEITSFFNTLHTALSETFKPYDEINASYFTTLLELQQQEKVFIQLQRNAHQQLITSATQIQTGFPIRFVIDTSDNVMLI